MFIDYAGSLLLFGFVIVAGGIGVAVACLVTAVVVWHKHRKTALSLISVVLLFAFGATYLLVQGVKRPSRELELSFQTELNTLSSLGFSCWPNSMFTTCLESKHSNQLKAKLPGGQVLEADAQDVFVEFLAESTTPKSITYSMSNDRPAEETIGRLLKIRGDLASKGGLRDTDSKTFPHQAAWIQEMAARTKGPITYAKTGPNSCQEASDIEVCLGLLANGDNTFTVKPTINFRRARKAVLAGPASMWAARN